MTKTKVRSTKHLAGEDSFEGTPAIVCMRPRCRSLVATNKGGYRMYLRHNSDSRRGSVGWFLCAKCADELAVWLGEYDGDAATGAGPSIRDAGVIGGSDGEDEVFKG